MNYLSKLARRIENTESKLTVQQIVLHRDSFKVFVKTKEDNLDLKKVEMLLREELSMPNLLIIAAGE
mgnify:CR=1 FL=1|tara:strand:+ start:8322 stop:8522 length:201 start_codon:yes stop_codon:yes gene_type:complete